MRRFVYLVALVPTLVAPGCGSSKDDGPSQPSGVVEIGPEGGELVDLGANGFPGFSIKIPPGALSAKVKVSFAGVMDATPLPEDGQRIGVQVKLLPAGTTLAKPAQLTLPMDHDLRAQFESPASDMKVWAREGEGWKLFEPVATSEESVTVEISAFPTAVAVGTFARATGSSCAACASAGVLEPLEPACTSPSGYCITEVPAPGVDNGLQAFGSQAMTVAGEKFFYLRLDTNSAGNATLTPISYGLFGAHETVRYPSATSTTISGAVTLSQMAIATNGDAWVAVGGIGSVRFPTTGLVQILDAPASENGGLTRPESVIVTKFSTTEERVNRFTSSFNFGTAIRSFISKTGTQSRQIFIGTSSEQFAALSTGPAYRGRSSRQGFCTQGLTATANTEPLLCAAGSTTSTFFTLPAYGEFALSTRGGAVAGAVPASNSTRLAKYQDGTSEPMTIPFPNGVSDMDFGQDGLLYAISATRPEIMIWDKASPGAVSILPLTSLPSSDPGYDDLLPRRIMNIPGKPNELLVVTKGNGANGRMLHRIRKAQ